MKNVPLIYQWHIHPSIGLLAIIMAYLYYKSGGFKFAKNTGYFFAAKILFLLVECSPLHFLGMHYYFSAHMMAHIILLLICGPLLVISIPQKNVSPVNNSLQSLSSALHRWPWMAWLAGVGIMWFWHIPAIFDSAFTAMENQYSLVPLLHAGSMLLAGMLFSWPLFGPFKGYRIRPLSGIVYLFTACISCSLLGLLITFAPLNTFHHYITLNASMQMGGLNPWGLSPKADQQAAGLIMWVPCCFVYLSGCLYLLNRWFATSDSPETNIAQLNPLIIGHE